MLQYILLNRALVDGCCMLGNQTSAVNTSCFRESGLSAICSILRETGLDPSAKPKALTLPCRPKHEHMRPRRRRRRPRSSPRPTARGLLLLFLLMLVVLLLLLSLLLLVGAYTMGMGTQCPGAPCCCCCCYCCTKPLGSGEVRRSTVCLFCHSLSCPGPKSGREHTCPHSFGKGSQR